MVVKRLRGAWRLLLTSGVLAGLLAVVLFGLLTPSSAAAQAETETAQAQSAQPQSAQPKSAEPTNGAAVTLSQLIPLALEHNPHTAAAQAEVAAAHAQASEARTALLPQISLTEDISRGNDPVYVFGTRLRQQRFTQADFALSSLNTPDSIGNFATRVSGGWQLFDSMRTERQIHAADLMREGSQSTASAVEQKVIFDVVMAYQQALYAEREVDTAQHLLETAQSLLASVDDHVRAGLAVESDRMAAQVNLAAARQTLIAARGDRDLAWSALRLAVGDPTLQAAALAPIQPRSFPDAALEDEVAVALTHRPDLAAVHHANQAQAANTSAARLAFGPQVTAYGNWENDAASIGGTNGSNWVVGMRIGIDLAPFARRAQLHQQQALKARADADESSYRQQVRAEVSQAHIERQTARQSMETAQAAIAQADESLRIVRNRYQAGLATITDLLRAEDAQRQSQTSYWRAVYANSATYAQLLFAAGNLTPVAAQELQ